MERFDTFLSAENDNRIISGDDGENMSPEVPSVAQPVVQEEQPAEQVKQPVVAEKQDEEKEKNIEDVQQSPPVVVAPKPSQPSQDEDGKDKVEEDRKEETRKNNLSDEEKKKYALTQCVDIGIVSKFFKEVMLNAFFPLTDAGNW